MNAGIPGFQEAMRGVGAAARPGGGRSYEHHVYEGASHAFFNDDGAQYDVKAARDSWARMLAFFSKALSG